MNETAKLFYFFIGSFTQRNIPFGDFVWILSFLVAIWFFRKNHPHTINLCNFTPWKQSDNRFNLRREWVTDDIKLRILMHFVLWNTTVRDAKGLLNPCLSFTHFTIERRTSHSHETSVTQLWKARLTTVKQKKLLKIRQKGM